MSKLIINFVVTTHYYFHNGQFCGSITIEDLRNNCEYHYSIGLKTGSEANFDILIREKVKKICNVDLYYLSDARANSIVLVRYTKERNASDFKRLCKDHTKDELTTSQIEQPYGL
jgi:hypothetical protein